MPNHKQIRRKPFPDHLDNEAFPRQFDRILSKTKSSTPHAPTISSSSASDDASPLSSLFLLANQASHEKEEEDANKQVNRKPKNSAGKLSRIQTSTTQDPSLKRSRQPIASHSEPPSRRSISRSSPGYRDRTSNDTVHLSTKEEGNSDSLEEGRAADTGAVSFDSSAGDHQPNFVRSKPDDSLVPKTVTITKNQGRGLISLSSEVANDTTDFVVPSRDSSERSFYEAEVRCISEEQTITTKSAPDLLTRTKGISKTVAEESVRIEDDVDVECAIEVEDIGEEVSVAESIPQDGLNRSAFATGTAVKKLCEKRGCWITGEVTDCEPTINAICRIKFTTEESADRWEDDSVHIQPTSKDLELLDKMVRLGRVCPGARVSIHWSEDDLFYSATVLQERLQNRKAFFIQYDDGESEWINLWFHEFQVLEDAPCKRKSKKTHPTQESQQEARKTATKKRKHSTELREMKVDTKIDSKKLGRKGIPGSRIKNALPREVRDLLAFDAKQDGKGESHLTVHPLKIDVEKKGKIKVDESERNDATYLRKDRRLRNSHSTEPNDELKKRGSCEVDTGITNKLNMKSSRSRQNIISVQPRKTLSDIASNVEETVRHKKRTSGISQRDIPNKSSNVKDISVGDDDSKSDDVDLISPSISDKNSKSSPDLWDIDSEESEDTDSDGNSRSSRATTEVVIGDRVGVYWNGDKKYYYGTVSKYDKDKKKPFFIEYDDGESEWIDFSKIKYRLVQTKYKSKAINSKQTKDSSISTNTKVKARAVRSKTSGIQTSFGRKQSSKNENDSHRDLRPRRSTLESKASSTRTKRKLSTDVHTSDTIVDDSTKIEVGTRVAVWWPEDNKYYEGVVTRKQADASWRPFFLEYDDGEEEWIDFRQHKYKILSEVTKEKIVHSSSDIIHSPCSDHSNVWIGTRLSVWWPMEKEYFDCTVTRYRDHKRSFYLEYDDGDREWINLAEHKFIIISNESRKRCRSNRHSL